MTFGTACNGSVEKDANTLLVNAVEEENFSKIKALVKGGADPNRHVPKIGSAMSNATLCSTPKCLELLIDLGGNPNLYRETTKRNIIFKVISPNKIEFVKLLVDRGADINVKDGVGNTPLMTAITLEQFDIALYLIEKGANKELKNNFGNDALKIYESLRVDKTLTSDSFEFKVKQELMK